MSPVLDRSAKDSPKYPSFISPKLKSDHTERKDTKPENQEKKDKPKLWKPFETDSPQKTGDKVKESEGESAVKDKCNNNIGDSVVKSDLHGNSVEGSSNNNNKKEHPTRPIPHYPSGVPKSAISEKNTSFTTFQPWKNDTRVNEATEHKTVSDSFGKTVSGTVHYKPDNRQYNYPQEQSKFESGTRYSHNISEKKFPDQLVNGVAHNLETVSTDQLNTTAENVAVSILRSGVSNTVTAEGLTETETENQSVTELKSNNQLASNDTKVEEFGAVENINSNCIPNTDTEVLNINETEINCLKSDSRGANHDTSGENVNINYKSESHIEIGSEVNKETKVEIENNTTNDIKDHSEISDELDDDKIKTKSTGKQRRISEVCASLLSLSHVTDSVSSAECAKTTDSVPVDNHSAINKSSSAELSKRKRRNSSLDKHTDLTERAPNSRTVKEPGYRTDYNFNQIGFEQQMSAMSGSCVQGYNNQVSCQSGMRHPYNYNENAVSYPPNMAGKNNQSFQDGLSHENAKTLPNHDAKQSISDFKMMKQSKVLTNAPQEQPQSDSFNQRLSNQNEYKSSPHDNSSKCSPARMSSSSSGTGPLSYGIFDTDSNTDSNFATSVSNAETNSTDIEPYVEVQSEPPFEWDYLHSKQFVDVIYKNQGCEFSGVVKSDLEIRESDSPKTFLDLDTITKPKPKANVSKSQGLDSMYSGMSDNQNYHRKQTSSPYYNQNTKGNSYNSQWGPQRANQNEYISGDTGTGAKGEGFGSNSNQGNQNYGNDYQKYSQTSQSNGVSQYDSSKGYQSQYNSQSNSGSSYYMSNHQHSQSGYHGNNYNESNQYYDPNQNSNQSYSSGQGYSNSYQNMNQQYGNSGYRGHSTGQNYQSNSHSPSSNQSYLPSNVENPEIDMVATPPKKEYKKRGRKRKAEKEQELNEQALNRPNTIVALLPNVGPLIHSENHTDSVDSYDYLNNPVETIFDYTYDESLPPIANQLLQIEQELCQRLLPLKYGYPVNVIYNPLVYAFQTHRDFVTKYCTSQRPILFLGMNPGPYGMSQNGVNIKFIRFKSLIH